MDRAAPASEATSVSRPAAPEVLTVPELAELLRCNKKSLYAALKANPNAIPGVRQIGSKWRAHRATVVAWLASGGQVGASRPRK